MVCRCSILCAILAATLCVSGCSPREYMAIEPQGESCNVIVNGPESIGRIKFWVPEAIVSNTGFCAVYPSGKSWEGRGHKAEHDVPATGTLGGGNCPLIDADTFECVGIRIPRDNPVRWRTEIKSYGTHVDIEIEMVNLGETTIEKAGAAVCIHFLDGDWWSSDRTYGMADGRVQSLKSLGFEAGRGESFQAYLVRGESFDNVFYQEFWGFNRAMLDRPMLVSECGDTGFSVVVEADRAYFLHCNRENPCTDLLLAFGDVKPGRKVSASGRLRIVKGSATALLVD